VNQPTNVRLRHYNRMAKLGDALHGAEEKPPLSGMDRLRVAFLVEEFPVISESFVINQAAGLIERGHDLRIFALIGRRTDTLAMHGSVARFRMLDRVSRPLASAFLLRGYETHSQSAVREGWSWSAPRRAGLFLSQVAMLAPHRAFDIVHCQFATLGLQSLRHRRLGTLQTRKLVVHLRGYDISQFVQERGADVYRDLFASADLFIANCEYFRQRAIDLGADPEKVIVIGSAIDCSHFSIKPAGYGDRRRPRLVSVGRLVEKKGFEYAIRGVAAAAACIPDLRYEIIGDGPLRKRLQLLVDELGMRDRIGFLGAMTHDQVVERLRQADIMLATSVRAANGDEDAPVNSLKEAMAVGLPVVATRHGGIPELVEDGVNGYLVSERDPEAIADRIRRLVSEPGLWHDMGLAGRTKVVAEYDQPVVTDRLIAAYRKLLEREERRR
jgi:colanic acid/amylovoran biosynthesis glycosyltransferase